MDNYYQGCGKEITGTHDQLKDELNELENSGEWIAEPKLDGIWSLFIGNGVDKPPTIISRSGKEKDPKGMPGFPEGYKFIGEFLFGTSHAKEIFEEKGHYMACIFDVIETPSYGSLIEKYKDRNRREILELEYRTNTLDHDYYDLVPQWETDFADHFKNEHEGLVLKNMVGGGEAYFGGGDKVKNWMKVKRKKTFDVIIFDYKESDAETKQDEPMAATLNIAMYIEEKNGNEDIAQDLGIPSKIDNCGLTDCGKVTIGDLDWCRNIAQDFDYYKGKVIEIIAYEHFKSGKFRHGSLNTEKNDVREKTPTECIAYRS